MKAVAIMKRVVGIISIVLLVVMFASMLSARQAWAVSSADGWSKTYGGNGEDVLTDLVQSSDGGYALAGASNSSGTGRITAWLVKTDASGNAKWNQTYGGPSIDDLALALVQTSDGGYALAGATNYSGIGIDNFWLAKTDAYGNTLWNKTYGRTNDDVAWALVQSSDGGYALAGATNSSSSGNSDFWLVKTDAYGNVEWNNTYGGPDWDAANSLVQTSDLGYAVAGLTYSFGAGGSDAWLVKTDANGNVEWNKTYGGQGDDVASALIRTSDGGYALAGITNSSGAGSQDFWLVKTDASGNLQWSKTYGGSGDDEASALIQTSDRGYALVGYTTSFGAGSEDFWLVRTDENGNQEWTKTYGGTDSDWAKSLVQTSDGGYVLAGTTYSFGAGSADFWLVKTDANGVVPEFPSALILIVLVAVTSLTVTLAKRFSKKPRIAC